MSHTIQDPCAEAAASAAARTRPLPRYGAVAWCYEEIAALYSLGRIYRAKASQLSEFAAGDRVLYAGVGCGEDAVLAARCGVQVTAVDCAEPMLRRLRRRLDREGLSAELVRADVLGHAVDPPGYDAVTANFVLNIFPLEGMRELLAHLSSLVRPGGKLLVADFAFPSGRAFERWLATAYYRPVNVAAWALRLCALHPLYDYASEMNALGFAVTHSVRFQPFGVGPILYESLVAARN